MFTLFEFQKDTLIELLYGEVPALLQEGLAEQNWDKIREAYTMFKNKRKLCRDYDKNDNLVIND